MARERYKIKDAYDQVDAILLNALLSAGALVASADGRVDPLERTAFLNFSQTLLLTVSQKEVSKAFDARVRLLKNRNSPRVILDTFKPLAGRSLASVVVRLANKIAAADYKIHPSEIRALELVRLALLDLPTRRRDQL